MFPNEFLGEQWVPLYFVYLFVKIYFISILFVIIYSCVIEQRSTSVFYDGVFNENRLIIKLGVHCFLQVHFQIFVNLMFLHVIY